MKKKLKKSKSFRAIQRKHGLGRYVVGASLVALGTQVHAADPAITPEQLFEGGTNTYSNWIEMSAGGMMTSGNKNQAAQGQRMDPGVFGGISDLHYATEVAKKTTFTLDGHSIFDQHDYSVTLGLKKEDFGYVRLLVENFRTWSSGIGGYVPVDKQAYALPGDPLALDRSQISFEAGLTKPNLPKLTFKYRHATREGDKDSTEWGAVHNSDGSTVSRVYPGALHLDETIDTFQLDLAHHYKDINYGVGVGYEHGNLQDTHYQTTWPGELGPNKNTDRQGTTYDLISTHAFAETWIKNNLFLSTGFMYANLDDSFSGSRIYGEDYDVAYSPAAFQPLGYYDLNGTGHKNEYVWNINLMSLPTKSFTITPSIRVQKENWNSDSTGVGTLNNDTEGFNSNSGRELLQVCERLDIRYTGITNWVFNTGGQWTEGQGNLNEHDGLTAVNGIGQPPVNFSTDDSRLFQKYFANARWYPTRLASLDFGGYYKINAYDYNNTQDNPPGTYPGFIVYQGFQTVDGNVRLTLRPFSKFTSVSRYEYQYSSINTRPDSTTGLGEQESSTMNTQILGQNLGWTPLNWLGLQVGVNYVWSTTKTPADGLTQSILNAQNNYWTANFNSDFVLDDRTDLDLGYFYYYANDFQNPQAGVGYGAGAKQHSVTATLTRRISQNLRVNVRFAYTHYNDTANSGYGNYESTLVSSSLQYRF